MTKHDTELFVIQCTTCRARLKVHDAAVVGQIIECPRCQSFVAVNPPPEWRSPTDAAARAAAPPAATGNASAPASVTSATAARTAAPPPLPKKSGSSAAGLSAPSIASAGATGPWAAPADRSVPAPQSAPAEVPAESLERRAASVPAALFGLNRWWIVVGVGGVLSIAAVALVLGKASSPASDPPPADPTHQASQTAEPMSPGRVAPAESAAVAAQEAPAIPPPTAAAAEPVAAADEKPADRQAVGVAKAPAAEPLPQASADGERMVARAIAPDVDPLGPTSLDASRDKPPASANDSTPAEAEEGAATESFDPVKQARLMAHLQDKLPALEFSNVPLGQFIAFLAEFSTVPMALDAISLAEAGKSAKTRISVKLDDATVEGALKAALAKPGLVFHIEPGRLVITARDASSR